jgi:hypothetical protein
MNLEHSLSLSEVEQLHHQLQLLAHSSLPLLHALSDAMKHSSAWFVRFNGDRSFVTHKKATKRGPAFEEENRKVVEKLRFTLKEFKERERLEVIDPYKVSPAHILLSNQRARSSPDNSLVRLLSAFLYPACVRSQRACARRCGAQEVTAPTTFLVLRIPVPHRQSTISLL